MVAVVVDATAVVFMTNLAVVPPTGMMTDAGSVAEVDEELSLTVRLPLFGPGCAFSVTTPLELTPPATLVGERVIPITWNGLSVRVVV